jgi:phospholipid/cholesterol/gamma-HCH transport system substrate-binding protein
MDLSYKREVTVGGLVILAVVLFLVGTTWLSGKTLGARKGHLWYIQFRDIGNLKLSSVVKVSGVAVGKVEDIQLKDVGKVLVGVSVPEDLVPHTDARAQIQGVGFVGDAVVVYNPGDAPTRLTHDQVILGSQDRGFTDKAAELGDRADSLMIGLQQFANKETADQLRQTLQQLQTTMASANRALSRLTDPKRGTTAELERTMISFRHLSDRLDSTLGHPGLARTLNRADTLTSNLAVMTQQLGNASAQLDSVLAGVNRGRGTIGKFATDSGLYYDLRELSASMKGLIDELQKNPGKLGITVKAF